jgi:hypothetical protein
MVAGLACQFNDSLYIASCMALLTVAAMLVNIVTVRLHLILENTTTAQPLLADNSATQDNITLKIHLYQNI